MKIAIRRADALATVKLAADIAPSKHHSAIVTHLRLIAADKALRLAMRSRSKWRPHLGSDAECSRGALDPRADAVRVREAGRWRHRDEGQAVTRPLWRTSGGQS